MFAILLDALDLASAGRKNAAKSKWGSLTPDFQLKILQLALTCRQNKEPLGCKVQLRSKSYGDITLDDKLVSDLATYVPQFLS